MTLADNAQWWKEVAEDLDKRLIAMRDECDAAVRKWELLKTGYDKEVRAAEQAQAALQDAIRTIDRWDATIGQPPDPPSAEEVLFGVRDIARAAKFGWREDHDLEREPDDGFGR